MMPTMNGMYPSDNPWTSFNASFIDDDENKDKPFLSLAFPSQKDYGLWNSTSPLRPTRMISSDESWNKNTNTITLDVSLTTPQEISYLNDWEDDVSVLNDNPEEDDIEVLYLPQSTYDVLMPLFDELYITDNEEEEKEETTS
jgi:hypothetical protein